MSKLLQTFLELEQQLACALEILVIGFAARDAFDLANQHGQLGVDRVELGEQRLEAAMLECGLADCSLGAAAPSRWS